MIVSGTKYLIKDICLKIYKLWTIVIEIFFVFLIIFKIEKRSNVTFQAKKHFITSLNFKIFSLMDSEKFKNNIVTKPRKQLAISAIIGYNTDTCFKLHTIVMSDNQGIDEIHRKRQEWIFLPLLFQFFPINSQYLGNRHISLVLIITLFVTD